MRLNFWFGVYWSVMLPVTLLTMLQSSVPYVAAISVWALIWSCYVGYIAAKVALAQQSVKSQLHEHHSLMRKIHGVVSSNAPSSDS